MKNSWLAPFVLASLVQIIGLLSGNETLSSISKPLLMPFLALWLLQETPGLSVPLKKAWLLGLLFSTLGDILLMSQGSLFFLLGLSAFLLAHLAYIGALIYGLPKRRGLLVKNPVWLLPFLLYPLLLLNWLWLEIPAEMRIPVAVYAVVITVMATSVANLHGCIPRQTFWVMMIGALLFVLSDSLIAINKFGYPFSGARLAVMTTYIAGQWLLVKGVRAILVPD